MTSLSGRHLFIPMLAGVLLVLTVPLRAADTPDPSSPKGTAAAFGSAIKAHDVSTAKSLTLGSANDDKIIDTFTAAAAARAKLHEAAQKKFGRDELTTTPPSPGRGPVGAERLSDMSQWEEKIDGDNAILTSKAEGLPASTMPPFQPGAARPAQLSLKRIDGKWKLDISSMVPTERTELYFSMLQTTTRVSNDFADDITADKYQTSEDAKAAYKMRMLAAVRSLVGTGGSGKKPGGP